MNELKNYYQNRITDEDIINSLKRDDDDECILKINNSDDESEIYNDCFGLPEGDHFGDWLVEQMAKDD